MIWSTGSDWTWLDGSLSAKVGFCLDGVLVGGADSDFVCCPTFHLIAWTDHGLVSVGLRLADGPGLASYWRFSASLLEKRDFRFPDRCIDSVRSPDGHVL